MASLQSQIDALQSRLNTANSNLSQAQASAKDACGDKDNCSSWIPFRPDCYSDTGKTSDQKDSGRCSTSNSNIATYTSEVTSLATQLNTLKAQQKIQGGATSTTKKVIIWSLIIIAVGLIIFFVGRHYKKW